MHCVFSAVDRVARDSFLPGVLSSPLALEVLVFGGDVVSRRHGKHVGGNHDGAKTDNSQSNQDYFHLLSLSIGLLERLFE